MELRHFIRRLNEHEVAVRDVVLCCLLAGGQRPQQMTRAQVKDYVDGTLTLMDGKGRRQSPRIHALPLAARAQALLDSLADRAQLLGSALLFTKTGRLPAHINEVSRLVRTISVAMIETGEAAEPFQTKDLRRTVETMLASMKVSKDIRAQLMSHGLAGVQSQRYDRYEYADEKRQALERWEYRLTEIESGTTSKVVPLPMSR